MTEPSSHNSIQFYLNGKSVEVELERADQTLLPLLRERLNLVATKEGCASGDCGACTIIVAEPAASKSESDWRYRTQNACISFARQMQGKHLVTLEALAQGKNLHPAQRAMVEHHGSQCGFCTPGIVMALAALYENQSSSGSQQSSTQQSPTQEQPFTRKQIEDALSGNLCRCTGYRPIIDAAMHMQDYAAASSGVEHWTPAQGTRSQDTRSQDKSITASSEWNPTTEDALKQVLHKYPQARIVAGATDLALEVTQLHKQLPELVAINNIASLSGFSLEDDYIELGAAASYASVEQVLSEHYPEFGQLLHRLGSRQVRNAGTLGGNIANASPIGDTPPVLIALGAEIELASLAGSRWLKLAEFYLDYKKTQLQAGEYLRTIRIPRLKPEQSLKVYKISKRLEDDISAVLMALVIEHDGNTIKSVSSGFGGMAAIPKAAPALEAALTGQPLSLASFEQAGAAISKNFQPLSDVRASADYRIAVTQGLLQKCAYELLQPNALSRVEAIHNAEVTAINVHSTLSGGARHA